MCTCNVFRFHQNPFLFCFIFVVHIRFKKLLFWRVFILLDVFYFDTGIVVCQFWFIHDRVMLLRLIEKLLRRGKIILVLLSIVGAIVRYQ